MQQRQARKHHTDGEGWVTGGCFILWCGCHVLKGLNCCALSSVGSFAYGGNKPLLSSRTIKEKRDAYVRRLNEIYANNLKKVRMCLSCKPNGEVGPVGFSATFPALMGVIFLPAPLAGSHTLSCC